MTHAQPHRNDICPHKQETQKIVNFDELRRRELDLRWREYNAGEKMFDAFVNTPYSMWLFVRRSFAEAAQHIRRPGSLQNGTVYTDRLSGGLYLDRAAVESDAQYALKHGLARRFQAKAAKVKRRAFEESRDFSVLLKTGQLEKISLQ